MTGAAAGRLPASGGAAGGFVGREQGPAEQEAGADWPASRGCRAGSAGEGSRVITNAAAEAGSNRKRNTSSSSRTQSATVSKLKKQ